MKARRHGTARRMSGIRSKAGRGGRRESCGVGGKESNGHGIWLAAWPGSAGKSGSSNRKPREFPLSGPPAAKAASMEALTAPPLRTNLDPKSISHL